MSGSLTDNYAAGGFGLTLQPGRRPALLVIDFVRAYLVEGSPLYAGAEPARAAAQTLLESARRARIPVVHTNVQYQQGGRDGGVFYRKVPALRCFEAGAHPDLAAFAAGLEPAAGETVITKQYASAVDACQHGFIPLVVREAVGDRHPAPHEANLFDLQAKYAEVVGLEMVVEYLKRIADSG